MILYVYLCTCICRDGGYGRLNEARVPSQAKPALGQYRHTPHAERTTTVAITSFTSSAPEIHLLPGFDATSLPSYATLARLPLAGSAEWRPDGEVIFEEGRSMTFLCDFRIPFLLLWIKGNEPTFESEEV